MDRQYAASSGFGSAPVRNSMARDSMPPGVIEKSMWLAYLLWLFFGGFGLHRLYLGYVGSGIAMMVLLMLGWTSFFTGSASSLYFFGPLGVWLLVDLCLIPSLTQRQNERMREQF